jgi:peptide-methionine (S)-S-oxide reductase
MKSLPLRSLAVAALLSSLLIWAWATAGASGKAAPARPAPAAVTVAPATADTAIFAGGCFWGVEAVFEHLKGVYSAESGYAGGAAAAPSYEQVSSGRTGHAESVRVVYDPAQISYAQLLQVFFRVAHDPTQLNRQGPDVGTQYRSAIFYRNAGQKSAAEAYVAELGRTKAFRGPIVTEIAPLQTFYLAEAYHQGYMERHPTQPYIVINDAPKLEHLQREFPELYRDKATAEGA